jgi:hypothetical protein
VATQLSLFYGYSLSILSSFDLANKDLRRLHNEVFPQIAELNPRVYPNQSKFIQNGIKVVSATS